MMTIAIVEIIPIMKNIRNTCNMLCNYILFILHPLLSTSHLSILILLYSF